MLPFWGYFCYLVLFYFSVKRCFTSHFHVIKIIIYPGIFVILSWLNFQLSQYLYDNGLWLWLSGFMMGIILIINIKKSLDIRVDKNKWHIELPGNYRLLLLSVSLFVIEYMTNYAAIPNSPLSRAPILIIFCISSSGLLAGMVASWHIKYLVKFVKSSHSNL